MAILHIPGEDHFLAYEKLHFSRKAANSPSIIFHHGMMSDMESSKALALEEYCKEKMYNFIRFDNFGHGKSSGEFEEQNITSWIKGLSTIIDQLTEGPVLLVGSSMGAWITMLVAQNYANKVAGVISIAGAIDCTELLIWNKLDNNQKLTLKEDRIIQLSGDGDHCEHTYPISYQLIEDGRGHLILTQDKFDIKHPLHIIHGEEDNIVPCIMAKNLSDKIISRNIISKIVKDAGHSLSRESDLKIIFHSIEELISG